MSKGEWITYFGERYLSYRNGRYSYLVKPEHKEFFDKYMIEGNSLNQIWLSHYCDYYFDHRTNQQFKGDKHADIESE